MKYKKNGIAIALFFINAAVLILSACGSNDSRPPFPKEEGSSASAQLPVRADFYIQATPTMKGFIDAEGEDAYFVKVVNNLDGALEYWSGGEFGSKGYYRFDIPGIGEKDTCYAIEANTFKNDAVDRKEVFFSLDWVRDHPSLGQLYKNLHTSTGGVIDTSERVFRNTYIAPVIKSLKDVPREDDCISIIVTDLLDYNLSNEYVEAVGEVLASRDGVGMGVLCINSAYAGELRILGKDETLKVDSRPFYVLVFGSSENVFLYMKSLKERLRMDGIPEGALDSIYSLKEKSSVKDNTSVITNYGLKQLSEEGKITRVETISTGAFEDKDMQNSKNVFCYDWLKGDGKIKLEIPMSLPPWKKVGELLSSSSLEKELTLNAIMKESGAYKEIEEKNSQNYVVLNPLESDGDAYNLDIELKNEIKNWSNLDADKFKLTIYFWDTSSVMATNSEEELIAKYNYKGTIPDFNEENSRGTPFFQDMLATAKRVAQKDAGKRLVAKTELYFICK